jgi:hypothetical protein
MNRPPGTIEGSVKNPGPGDYIIPEVMGTSPSRTMYARFDGFKNSPNKKTPGPGHYDEKSRMSESSPSFSMGK